MLEINLENGEKIVIKDSGETITNSKTILKALEYDIDKKPIGIKWEDFND